MPDKVKISAKHELCPATAHYVGTKCKICELLKQAEKGAVEAYIASTAVKESADPCLDMAQHYPKYYKAMPENWDYLDTYRVNILFPVTDDSGCILHARKKLLVPGTRTGGKGMYDDVREARDTLNRWLEDNQ